jgi:hypothetical protein
MERVALVFPLSKKLIENHRWFLALEITQKDHSTGILKDLQKFFGSRSCRGGLTVSKRDKTVEFFAKNFEDILLKIIPHFEAYPLVTSKELNFESFKEAALFF